MKTGVSTASLFMRKSNLDALPFLEELGVKTAEVFLTSFSEYGKAFGTKIAKRKGNVQINSMHVLNTQFEPQLFNRHPTVRKDAFDWLNKVLAGAKAFGAPYYTFHGTARIKRAARSGVNDDFPSMIAGFQEIIQTCKNYGVTLCLENVEWATYNRVGVFSRIWEEARTLRGVLDIKQARISGTPYEEYLNEMGERIAYVHVSDITEKGKMCLPGQGTFDFDTLIRRLQDVGFTGDFIVEAYTGDYGRDEELKDACAYLDELLYKHNCLTK